MRQYRESSFSRLLQWAFYAFVAIGLLGTVAIGYGSWEREKADAREQLKTLSGFMGSATEAFFNDLGHGLQSLGDLLRHLDVENSPEAARPYLDKFRARYPQIRAMAIFDTQGRMLVNTAVKPGAPLPNLRAWPAYLASLRAAWENSAPYAVDRPEYGKAIEEWRFAFRFAVRDERGRALFLIQAAIPLGHSMNFLSDLALPPGSQIGVLRDDGYQQLQWPIGNPNAVYGQPSPGPLWQVIRAHPTQREGFFMGERLWMFHENQRIGAYRHLKELPMVAYVSIPYTGVWRSWWKSNSPVLAVFFLVVVIFGAIAFWVRVSERRHSQELLNQARNDSLTGLPNRAGANALLEQQIEQAMASGRSFALLFFDLDHFKDINDTLGHGVGDQLLVEASRRAQSALRQGDTMARIGGDEFLMVLPGSSLAAAIRSAQRVIDAMEPPLTLAEHRLKVSCSIGIATFPEHGTNRETLLKHADSAMYEAKRRGRSGYACYEAGLGERLKRRLELALQLREALSNQALQLSYQPILDLHTGEVVCAEALVRWPTADGTQHDPSDFIPLAEESGLILPLGEWVLLAACRQGKAWMDAGFDLRIAVNLSTRQFRDPHLLDKVSGVLQTCGLPASRLELEITEGAAMANPESSVEVMNGLKRLGVRIAIDDFGTGYSSLSYLKRIPADVIKIDKSFVGGVSEVSEDRAIVVTILALAGALDKTTVAEGIETPEQLQTLARIGCAKGQGYLFSRPLSAEAFLAFLRQPRRVPRESLVAG